MVNSAYFPPTVNFVEGRHTGEYIKSEANWMRSRDNVVLAAGNGPFAPGTVLGAIMIGVAAPPVATVGNAGNGVVSAVTLGSKGKVGTYTIEFTGATAYQVLSPDGKQLAAGTGAGAYGSHPVNPEIGFTFAPGSTAMAAGDSITITVAPGSQKFVPVTAGALDGSEVAAAILYASADATYGDVPIVITARDSEIYAQRLTFDASIAGSPALISAALAQLAAKGIVAR